MADFKKAYAYTMGNEGGLADDPDDAGGLTYKGITSRDWPAWAGWPIVKAAIRKSTSTKGANLLLATNVPLQNWVYQFYKTHYWDVHQLDKLNAQAIAEELFDSSVNCGTSTAGEWLQNALNEVNTSGKLVVDGIIGTATLMCCNATSNVAQVYHLQNVQQKEHYLDLVTKNPKYAKFLKSWLSRVDERGTRL